MSCCISSLTSCCTPFTSVLEKTGLSALGGAVKAVSMPILRGFGGSFAAFMGLSLCLKMSVVITAFLGVALIATVAHSCCFAREREVTNPLAQPTGAPTTGQ